MEISDLKTEIGESTLKLVLLGACTLGIYYFIWLAERYKIFNKMAGREIVNRNIMILAAFCVGFSTLLDGMSSYEEDLAVDRHSVLTQHQQDGSEKEVRFKYLQSH